MSNFWGALHEYGGKAHDIAFYVRVGHIGVLEGAVG